MPFTDITLAEVEIEKISIPVGTYTWQLMPGAQVRMNKNSGQEELSLRFAVADGPEKGKGVFVGYPDPTVLSKNGKPQKWSAQALKKLEIALGVDANEGESMPDYFNRVATESPALITAELGANNYVKDGKTVEQTRFGIFTVAPAVAE